MIRIRAGRLALLFSSTLFLLAVTAGIANAATATEADGKLADKMTFIGDSVTAGFGYCGTAENADSVECATNQEMDNAWFKGKNTLSDCKPPDHPNDACSNNNFNGRPWEQGPWSAGANAPDVAYPFQIAQRQTGPVRAEVSDWALTGSTPSMWDPSGGVFGHLLDRLNDQYVGMTIGANPLLAYYTNVALSGYHAVRGPCVGSTGYYIPSSWFFVPDDWYARDIQGAVACLREHWAKLDQTQHLVNIYHRLLAQDDRVVVLGYYRDCSWSFGNWQPAGNILKGPAAGNSCKDEVRELGPHDKTKVSQWEQAVAVGNELNHLIHDAVEKAQDQAKQDWPGTDRWKNLVYTQPNEAEWEQHQPKSDNGSWVLLNDTWIHPNKAGAANLADTVEKAMCQHFDHWCGNTEWSK